MFAKNYKINHPRSSLSMPSFAIQIKRKQRLRKFVENLLLIIRGGKKEMFRIKENQITFSFTDASNEKGFKMIQKYLLP